jgi:hypothetical protein
LHVVLAQLRQMPSADWSPDSTHEHQDDALSSLVVRKSPCVSVQILSEKFWRTRSR